MATKFAIIVAGGAGRRMQADLPKQFIPIGGKPILMHTIECFRDFDTEIEIILVLPESQVLTWEHICSGYNFDQKKIRVVEGGATRFLSVKNGLKLLENENGLVAIHDGVRPFVNKEIIAESFKYANLLGNAVVSVPLKESIRKITPKGNKTIDRGKYQLVQTPQVFKIESIYKSYELALNTNDDFFDDATVAELAGEKINLIDGSYDNIKITTPEDLNLAEIILKKRESKKKA